MKDLAIYLGLLIALWVYAIFAAREIQQRHRPTGASKCGICGGDEEDHYLLGHHFNRSQQ